MDRLAELSLGVDGSDAFIPRCKLMIHFVLEWRWSFWGACREVKMSPGRPTSGTHLKMNWTSMALFRLFTIDDRFRLEGQVGPHGEVGKLHSMH